jgi:hypothetical protein
VAPLFHLRSCWTWRFHFVNEELKVIYIRNTNGQGG